MPVKFTEKETKEVKIKLKKEAYNLFITKGFKKTSLDLIVNATGIAKGSFYKFYENKESLYFHLLMDIEKELHEEQKKKIKNQPFIEAYKQTFVEQVNYIKSHPLLKNSVDLEFMGKLWSRLPKKDQEASIHFDYKKMNDLEKEAKKNKLKLTNDTHTTLGILRSLVFTLLHDDIMGIEKENASNFIIESILGNLFEEDK